MEVDLGLVVNADSKHRSYSREADQLVKSAAAMHEGRRAEGYNDDKAMVTLNGLETLIGAGARISQLNVLGVASADHYYHEVVYKEHTFIAVSPETFAPQILSSRQ